MQIQHHTQQVQWRAILVCVTFLLIGYPVAQAQWVVSEGPQVVLRDPKTVTLGADLKLAPLPGQDAPLRFFRFSAVHQRQNKLRFVAWFEKVFFSIDQLR